MDCVYVFLTNFLEYVSVWNYQNGINYDKDIIERRRVTFFETENSLNKPINSFYRMNSEHNYSSRKKESVWIVNLTKKLFTNTNTCSSYSHVFTAKQLKYKTLLCYSKKICDEPYYKSQQTMQPIKKYTVSEKNILDISDCSLKKNYHILVIFDQNISDTTGHQMTV